tara:strand:+ start:139 stop:381 length:243 start_codon:yes stop_codon:yes gene_type:complete
MQNTLSDLLTAIGSNEQLQKFYASQKCKECLGRGWKQIVPPNPLFINTKDYDKKKKKKDDIPHSLCHCIIKKAREELKDG